MTAPTPCALSLKTHHTAFLAIVPRIERHGRVYFHGLRDAHKREDAIASMVALSWR